MKEGRVGAGGEDTSLLSKSKTRILQGCLHIVKQTISNATIIKITSGESQSLWQY